MFLCFHVVGRRTLRWPRNWTIYFTKHVVGRCTLRWNSDYIFQFLCCWYVSNVKVYSIFEFPCCLEVLERPKKANLLIFNSIQTCICVSLLICFSVFMLLDVVRNVDLKNGLYISLRMLLPHSFDLQLRLYISISMLLVCF